MMLFNQRLDFGQNVGVLRGDVVAFAGIDFEIEQQWRIVLVGLRLVVAGLREEMSLPGAATYGEQVVAAIKEHFVSRALAAFQRGRNVVAVERAIIWRFNSG